VRAQVRLAPVAAAGLTSVATAGLAAVADKEARMELDQIASLLRMLHENDVSEFAYNDANIKLRIRLGPPPAPVYSAPPQPQMTTIAAAPVAASAVAAAPAADAGEAGLVTVESPMVGTFYASPSPGAPPFVEVGGHVAAGKSLCIIEAMKLMNQIEAEISGTVVARLVQDGQPVEFGTPIFKIRPG
jgi:acetyl-CoA carboxylase biotin carboxyl carrier protein